MAISLSTFEHDIDEKILDRGLKYFQRGHVDEPDELEPGLYEAIVQGTEPYTVQVRIQGDTVTEQRCDCPYDLGDVCKHVAALLFKLQEDALDLPVNDKGASAGKKAKRSTPKKPTVAQQVDRALAAVPHEELVAYVRARCMDDAGFRQHFLSHCAPEAITQDHHDYLKQVRQGLRAVAGRGGFIGWDESYAAGVVLDDKVEKARTLFHKGHPAKALPMLTAVLKGGAEAMEYADDSNGDIGGGITSAMELLHEMAKAEHDEPFRLQLLSEVQRLLADEQVSECDWNEVLLPTAASLMRSDSEAAPIMAALKQAANEDFSGSSAREALIDLTRRFHGDAEAAKLEEGFLRYTDVREKAIEAAIKSKDWKRARQLAEDGARAKRDGGRDFHAHDWKPHLLRIAQLTKDDKEVIRLARLLLLESLQSGMEYYKLLRVTVPPSEWPEYIDQVLKDMRAKRKGVPNSLLANICAAEERWSEVLIMVREEGWHPHCYYTILNDHEQELGKRFPAEVSAILAERAEALASRTGAKGDDYDKAVRMLRRIRKLGEGQLADALAADWRVRLKRRPRLMEVLGKG